MRDFGVFMGFTVVTNFFVVMTLFPMCVVSMELIDCCQRCCKCLRCCPKWMDCGCRDRNNPAMQKKELERKQASFRRGPSEHNQRSTIDGSGDSRERPRGRAHLAQSGRTPRPTDQRHVCAIVCDQPCPSPGASCPAVPPCGPMRN